MKRWTDQYNEIREVILYADDLIGVCAKTADNKGNICINIDRDKYGHLRSIQVSVLVEVENDPDSSYVATILKEQGEDTESLNNVIDLFLTLAKPGTIDFI